MLLYAKDIVENEFLSLPPKTSVLDAAKAMARVHQGFVIASAPDGKPVGIVTEWDLLSKVVAEARDPAHVRLEDIMTRPLLFVNANDGIDRVAELMAEKDTRRVLVEKDGNVIGVIRVQTILGRMKEYLDSISAQIARAQMPLF